MITKTITQDYVIANYQYQILDSETNVICDKPDAFTVILPIATLYKTLTISNVNTGDVTILRNGQDLIDGETSQLIEQDESITLYCYALEKWKII